MTTEAADSGEDMKFTVKKMIKDENPKSLEELEAKLLTKLEDSNIEGHLPSKIAKIMEDHVRFINDHCVYLE